MTNNEKNGSFKLTTGKKNFLQQYIQVGKQEMQTLNELRFQRKKLVPQQSTQDKLFPAPVDDAGSSHQRTQSNSRMNNKKICRPPDNMSSLLHYTRGQATKANLASTLPNSYTDVQRATRNRSDLSETRTMSKAQELYGSKIF